MRKWRVVSSGSVTSLFVVCGASMRINDGVTTTHQKGRKIICDAIMCFGLTECRLRYVKSDDKKNHICKMYCNAAPSATIRRNRRAPKREQRNQRAKGVQKVWLVFICYFVRNLLFIQLFYITNGFRRNFHFGQDDALQMSVDVWYVVCTCVCDRWKCDIMMNSEFILDCLRRERINMKRSILDDAIEWLSTHAHTRTFSLVSSKTFSRCWFQSPFLIPLLMLPSFFYFILPAANLFDEFLCFEVSS